MDKTLVITQYAEALAARTGYTIEFCEKFIAEMFRTVADALADGTDVNISGFGRFYLKDEGGAAFLPFEQAAERINEPFSMFEPEELDDDISDEMLDTEIAIEKPETPRGETNTEVSQAEETPTEEVASEETFTEEVASEAISNEEVAPEEISTEDVASEEISAQEASAEEIVEEPMAASIESTTETASEIYEQKGAIESPAHVSHLSDDEDDDDDDDYFDPYFVERRWRRRARKRFILGMLAGLAIGAAAMWGVNKYILNATDDSTLLAENSSSPSEKPQTKLQSSETEVADEATSADTAAAAKDAEKSVEMTESPLPASETPAAKLDVSTPVATQITDTVRSDNYLATMSRHHYGTYEFWVYIYEENRDKLSHPDHVAKGTVVVIPPAKKYGIDCNDPESIRRATELAKEIYARFK